MQILMAFIQNIKCTSLYIDYDSAKLLEHYIKMWEHKRIVIDNWAYSTTGEWDSVSLLALPIYGITKNIFLSVSVTNMLHIAIFGWAIWFINRRRNPIYSIIPFLLIVFPWGMGMLDYFNMLFFSGSQYFVKVVSPLLFVGILLYIENEGNTKGFWKRKSFLLSSLLFLYYIFLTTSSSGVYVCVVGIAPICFVYALYKLIHWEKVNCVLWVVLGIMLVAVVAGYLVNISVLGGTRANTMRYVSLWDFFDNFRMCILGLYQMFGAISIFDDVSVMSILGIGVFLRFIFVSVLLAVGAVSAYKVLRRKNGLQNTMLTFVFFWNLLILILTNTTEAAATYEYRYHLVGIIPLIIVATTYLIDFLKETQAPNIVWMIPTYAIWAVCLFFVYRSTLNYGEQIGNVKELVSYFNETDYERIYVYAEMDVSEELRLWGNPKHYLCTSPDGNVGVCDFYDYYTDTPIVPEDAALIIRKGLYDFSDGYTFAGYTVVKDLEIGNYETFYFE